MTTTFETNPPQSAEEAKLFLHTANSALIEDPELAAENFALAIYPLCCVVDIAYSGADEPSKEVLLNVCEQFELASRKLLDAIRAWFEYKEARRLVDSDAETTMQSNTQAKGE